MSSVAPLPAALAGLVLFFVPGLTLLALLGPRERRRLAPDEAAFLAVGVSVAASAWMAIVLAEVGFFSLPRAALFLAAASLAALGLGRGRASWPRFRKGRLRDGLPFLAVLGLAIALQARPSECIVGGRDPGAYVAAMGLIGRTGGIVYRDPAVLSVPAEDVELFYRNAWREEPYSWSRFMGFELERPSTGRVVPQFFHLFPAFGAYLFQAMGLRGALATSALFGVLGTLGVFLTLRRLFGPPPALLASLLLGLNMIQVWFARYPVSEPMSQFLLFLGLLAFLHWERTGSATFGGLAGAALGLTLLVRIDSVLVLLPLALYLLWRRGRRDLSRRQAAPLLLSFAVLALHAAIHAAFFSFTYVRSIVTRDYWRQPPLVWLALALAVAAAATALDQAGPRLRASLRSQRRRLVTLAGGGLVLLALYGYFLRPLLSAWAGADGNPREKAWNQAGLLASLGFRRLAAHDAQSLVRLGWFVSPLALALGLAGALVVIRHWRRRYLFPVLLAATVSGFYLYKVRVWNDYPFAMRRFVPLTLPFLLGLAALVVWRLWSRGGGRRFLGAVAGLFLMASYALETGRILSYTDWKGAVGFVLDVARRFGPDDVVVFEQPKSIHLLSLPLWAAYGVNALELARFNPDPDRLQHLISTWRSRYRNIYFVHTYRTDLCGVFLQRVQPYDFGTFELFAYDRRPTAPEFRSLHFTISRVVPPEDLQVPALPEVDIGGSDDFQVSGFYEKEGYGDETFRWTGSCASVYLPGARAGADLVVRASTGQRPLTAPVPVRVSMAGHSLGTFEAAAPWVDHVLRLPDPLPPGPPVLRLDVPPFRPVNGVPGSTDTRELGVMVDRIGVKISVSPDPAARVQGGGAR